MRSVWTSRELAEAGVKTLTEYLKTNGHLTIHEAKYILGDSYTNVNIIDRWGWDDIYAFEVRELGKREFAIVNVIPPKKLFEDPKGDFFGSELGGVGGSTYYGNGALEEYQKASY